MYVNIALLIKIFIIRNNNCNILNVWQVKYHKRSSNTKTYFLSFDREVELHRYGILGGLIKGLKTS